jgi:hypothetical protein
MDTYLHHDNAVLQAKVNSLQRLVDEMTKANHNLRAQLKQHKSIRQNIHDKKEKILKLILLNKISPEGQFLFVCRGTCKILGMGVMLGPVI